MKTRSFFSVLTAIVLVLLLTGGAGAYWLSSHTPYKLLQGVEASTPEASMFVSQQSPLVVSLLVNPDRLTALGLASTPARQRKQIQVQWQRFRQNLLDQNGWNYKRDIQPWLGDEITFAVTTSDFDRNLSNGQQPGYLIAAAIKHPEQAEQAIQAYWQQRALTGINLVFEQFAGVNLIYGNPERGEAENTGNELESIPALTTAIVGNRFVLFANSPKVMRDAINNLQVPELSLGSSEAYEQALQQLSTPHIGNVYVHLPQLATWLEESDLRQPGKSSIATPAPTFDSLVMAIQLDSQGVIGDTLVLATDPLATERLATEQLATKRLSVDPLTVTRQIEPTKPELSAPVQALQYLPATSTLAASGKNLPQLWRQLNTGLQGYAGLKDLIYRPLYPFQQRWQLELDELFSWVEGEYALGRVPGLNSARPDWIFVAERSPLAIEKIAKLDELAQTRGISVSSFTVADQPVMSWTKLSTTLNPPRSGQRQSLTVQATVEGVHTTIGNYEIFATSLDAMAATIQASENSLLNAEKFQQAIAPLPLPNGGYFYVDSVTLQTFLDKQLADSSLPFSALRPVLESLRSVTISGYGSEANASRGIVFLRL